MALNPAQQLATAQYAGQQLFAAAVATFGIDDLQAAVAAVDSACDTTLNNAVAAGHGAQTVVQAFNAVMPSPFSGATLQQKSLLVSWVIMKRAGLL